MVAVEPDSKGSEAGILAGDLIKEINHQKIKTVEDFKDILAEIETGETMSLFIRRMNAGFIVLKMEK